MDAIRKYLISLCAAALLCALVRALVPGGRMKKLCSLLCGIFLMTAALSGISGWQLSDFAQELSKMQVAAEQARREEAEQREIQIRQLVRQNMLLEEQNLIQWSRYNSFYPRYYRHPYWW